MLFSKDDIDESDEPHYNWRRLRTVLKIAALDSKFGFILLFDLAIQSQSGSGSNGKEGVFQTQQISSPTTRCNLISYPSHTSVVLGFVFFFWLGCLTPLREILGENYIEAHKINVKYYFDKVMIDEIRMNSSKSKKRFLLLLGE